MENENNLTPEQDVPEQETEQLLTEESTPVSRPLWQRIGAGICLVAFIALIIMYYINIMRGGR